MNDQERQQLATEMVRILCGVLPNQDAMVRAEQLERYLIQLLAGSVRLLCDSADKKRQHGQNPLPWQAMTERLVQKPQEVEFVISETLRG